MGEKKGMREAIDRVATRIHQHNVRSGKSTTFEEARRVALDHGSSFDRRNPSQPRPPKKGS